MIAQKIIKRFGSWWMTAALLLLFCLSYISFIFTDSPYANWVNFLSRSLPGITLCISLIANLLCASLHILFDRIRQRTPSPEDIRTMDASAEIALHGTDTLADVTAWMKRHGFTGKSRGNAITAEKGKFSFLPGTLMRTGLIMLITALLFSAYLRKTGETVLHEKETYAFSGSELMLETIRSNFPAEFLQVGEEETFTLGSVSAVLLAAGNAHTITSGFPARIRGNYYRISDIGFSQELSLESSGEKIEKRLDLNILPPGKTDVIALPPSNLFLTVTLHPEKTIRKGLLTGKQFSLVTPAYRIVMQRGKEKEKPETITIRPGEHITTGDVTLSLGKNALFIRILSVYDPALFWIYAGFLLTLAGIVAMVSRFFWYQRQLSVLRSGDTFFIGYRQEFFRKWGVQKFHWWQEELVSSPRPAVEKSDSSG